MAEIVTTSPRGVSGLWLDVELRQPVGTVAAGPVAKVFLNEHGGREATLHRREIAEVIRLAVLAWASAKLEADALADPDGAADLESVAGRLA